MAEHKITLDDIYHEAALLEFDVTIAEEGHLNIVKRGDRSTYYYSLQPVDDERVLSSAYEWLQHYRASLDQLDQARAHLDQHPPTAPGNALIRLLLSAASFLPAIAVGAGLLMVSNNVYLGYGVMLALVAVTRPLQRRRSRRRRLIGKKHRSL